MKQLDAKKRAEVFRIAAARLDLNLTELATKCDSTPATMSYYLNGKRNPRLDQFATIIHALKLDKETVLKLLGFK